MSIIEAAVYKSLRAKAAAKEYEEQMEKKAMLRREQQLLDELKAAKAVFLVTTAGLLVTNVVAIGYIALKLFNFTH